MTEWNRASQETAEARQDPLVEAKVDMLSTFVALLEQQGPLLNDEFWDLCLKLRHCINRRKGWYRP